MFLTCEQLRALPRVTYAEHIKHIGETHMNEAANKASIDALENQLQMIGDDIEKAKAFIKKRKLQQRHVNKVIELLKNGQQEPNLED